MSKKLVCVAFVVALGSCGVRGTDQVAQTTQAATSTNGLWTNGLATNGLWTNGLWTNGLWTNGLWTNGLWTNGLWTNGLWTNGLWTNGLWTNGLWTNGLWTNGLWTNGLWTNGLWTNGLTGDTLRSSAYTRQLLQYVYACAMPGAYDPVADQAIEPQTYTTTLDPNSGALTCNASQPCAAGYTCSDQGTCVVQLTGAIGLGINHNGTGWWQSGQCDETCQRWVSACVLARTNAYGVHVDISLRAPSDAPAAIQRALRVTPDEATGYTLREGAYYGNLFETTPVNPPPSSGSGSSTGSGSLAELGTIVATPQFYACAGPGSNIPEITKRFCSSQGDQSVIKVPGVCLATASELGVCDGADAAGNVLGCHTSTDHTTPAYHEVITTYLKTPIAVCGNAVCESTETSDSCASDCHPGGWSKALATEIGNGLRDQNANNLNFVVSGNMAISATDNTVVLAGTTQDNIDLGGGTLGSSLGWGVLAKYSSTGAYQWSVRFGNANSSFANGQLFQVNGVTVTRTGNIWVVGTGTGQNSTGWALWLTSWSPTGTLLGQWTINVGSASTLYSLQASRVVTTDSSGNLLAAMAYAGNVSLGTFHFSSTGNTGTFTTSHDVLLAKISPTGAVLNAQSFGTSQNDFPLSIATDAQDNILLVPGIDAGYRMVRKLAPNMSVIWAKQFPAFFSAVNTDADGNIFLTGSLVSQNDLGDGPMTDVIGFTAGLVKYAPDGTFLWERHAKIPCVRCSTSSVDAIGIVFDGGGNAVIALQGSPSSGGIDFGVGTFPVYATQKIFLAAYASDTGSLRWAKEIPTILSSNLTGIGITADQRLVLSGDYSGSMQLDDHLLVTGTPELQTYLESFFGGFAVPSTADSTAPAIGAALESTGTPLNTLPQTIVAQATSSAGASVFFMPPTALDTGNAGTNVTCTPASFSTFPIGTTTVTCTATDPLGNKSTATFQVIVRDSVAPVFAAAPDVTAQAITPSGIAVPYTAPRATDQADGARPVTCTPASNSVFAVGTTTVTCTASDNSHNAAQTHFSVTVLPPADSTPPVITVPSAMTVAATSHAGAAVAYSASATDDVGVTSFACTPASGSTFGFGSTTVTCSASDAAGHTTTATFTITVADTTAPVVKVPGSLGVEATGPAGSAVTYAASAADDIDGTVATTCSPASGTTFAVGTATVICSATDAHGNTGTAAFGVTVTDTTPPQLSVPAPIAIEATGPAGAAVTYATSANDLVDGPRAVTCSAPSGTTFAVGTTSVTCFAVDSHGNTATKAFTVTVTDTTPPDVTVPAPITVEATGPGGAVVAYSATATDLVDGARAVTCSPASGSTFALATTTVTCSASDARGNSATGSFTVTVVDTTPPQLALPANITTTANQVGGAVATYSASANDLVDGAVNTSCTPASGSLFAPGTTTVTCTAADARGNTAHGTFTVQVAYAWSGFLQPINPDGSSIFHGGTVPVKFQLTGASAGLTNVVATLQVAKVSSSVTGTYTEATSTSAASTGSQFRYDPTTGTYIFNLATSSVTSGTWSLLVTMDDGVTHSIQISIR